MKTVFAVFLALAAALICIAPSVSRAEIPSNYVVLKGGFYSPSKDFSFDNVNGGQTDRRDSKTGFDGEVAFGHYFLPVFATELGVGYFESKDSAAAQPGEAKLKVVPVVLTAKGLLPLGSVVEPYGEFGIGAYITKLDVTVADARVSGSSKTTVGLHAGAGVNFNLSQNLFLGVEGRYLWAKPSFGGADVKLDGFTLTGDLGFRF
jgi:opacity protein-like surface antigen